MESWINCCIALVYQHFENTIKALRKIGKNQVKVMWHFYMPCAYEKMNIVIIIVENVLKSAKLPRHKVLSDFKINRIPGLSPALIHRLATGDFMDTPENLLIFGNPGTGKSHLSIALAREWCLMGRRVLFKGASQIVEELRQAQEKKELHRFMKQLDHFDCLIIDDICYVHSQG
jgi:DNA replication protein DnaC